MPTGADPVSSVEPLDSAARVVMKGTLVPLEPFAQETDPHAPVKYGTVRQLALSPGDTDAVRDYLVNAGRGRGEDVEQISNSTLDVLRSFESPLISALEPGIAAVAAVPVAELASFANALVGVRTQLTKLAQDGQLRIVTPGTAKLALNSAVVAARGLEINTAAQPSGMLNLERIEMVPAGIQRGELVATIPLAPGEETAVTHKEWSVTSKEFTTIVTDAFESTSETGVTDNTDLSQSTTSQNQHSTQFNITATVQGGIPIISGSATAGATAQDASSTSAIDSIKHATAITQKASSRSRQEHKTTISTTTVTGTDETSTRVLKNTSTTDPIRIDYFSLMRRWRVRLYRFGLRLTYDLVVPEPGAAMRRAYAELAHLRDQLGPFVFDTQFSDVTDAIVDEAGNPVPPGGQGKPKYVWLADKYGVAVRPYPSSPATLFPYATGAGSRDWVYMNIEFVVPTGAQLSEMYLTAKVGNDNDGDWPRLEVMGARFDPAWYDKDNLQVRGDKVFSQDGSTFFMEGATGHQIVTIWLMHSSSPWVGLRVVMRASAEATAQWRADTYNALFNAAQAKHYAEQQEIAERVSALEEQLANVDTLTLRREESDEVMKGVLRFVLGASFDFMPADVHKVFEAAKVDLAHGVGFDGSSLGLQAGPELGSVADQWSVLRHHEDIVRFINEAIEWENVVTFLYSYFWDTPESWPFIRSLRHPDPTRQAFLRAGSARVVLTVRKGWEAKWMRFVQDGTVDADIAHPSTGPYLSIAQEIAAYDDRNYPGIPPANPAKAAVRLQDSVFTTTTATILASRFPVVLPVADSAGFVVGLPVVLDIEDDRHVQETVVVTDIPDAAHITVDHVDQAHDGSETPVPVLQPGDKGTLIAEWSEYTPSSGTDIAVTSNLATIA